MSARFVSYASNSQESSDIMEKHNRPKRNKTRRGSWVSQKPLMWHKTSTTIFSDIIVKETTSDFKLDAPETLPKTTPSSRCRTYRHVSSVLLAMYSKMEPWLTGCKLIRKRKSIIIAEYETLSTQVLDDFNFNWYCLTCCVLISCPWTSEATLLTKAINVIVNSSSYRYKAQNRWSSSCRKIMRSAGLEWWIIGTKASSNRWQASLEDTTDGVQHESICQLASREMLTNETPYTLKRAIDELITGFFRFCAPEAFSSGFQLQTA